MNISEINTDRLFLRKLKLSDTTDLYEITSNPDVTEYLTWYPHTNTEYTKNFIESSINTYNVKNSPSQWAIILKEKNKLIGITGCNELNIEHEKAEISFLMNPAFSRSGFMKEANAAVISNLFEIGLNRVQAKAEISNIPSCKVLEACGFKREGIFRDYLKIKGKYRTYNYYAVLKSDYNG